MQGNDLSNAPTRRFWVLSDAVMTTDTSAAAARKKKHRWWKKGQTEAVATLPDLAALSKLWRWSNALGVRLELVFVGDTTDAPAVWQMLERGSANPFADWLAFENFSAVARDIPYRPDLLGVVDTPDRSAIYGGKGMTMNSVPNL